jgi:hypothetical protein
MNPLDDDRLSTFDEDRPKFTPADIRELFGSSTKTLVAATASTATREQGVTAGIAEVRALLPQPIFHDAVCTTTAVP